MSTKWLMTARLPETRLVIAAQEGDERAVDDLARAWLPHVYRWCHRLGGPGFDAEDSAHEVLMVMVRRLPTLAKPQSFPSWLFGITRRVVANHRRRAWWRRWVPGWPKESVCTAAGPDRSAESRQAQAQVWKVLEQLSDAHREVLILCLLEERSCSEAALLLDVPLGTVKSRLRAARERFRSVMNGRVSSGPLTAVEVG